MTLDPVTLGDGAQLLHHAHHVPVSPALYDLALRDAVDGYPGPGQFSVRRLDTHESTPVGPHRREAGGHHVCFGQLNVDRVVEVGEGLAELFGEGLHRLHSVKIAGIFGVVMLMVDVVGSIECVSGI
jgi:hypothetical protein